VILTAPITVVIHGCRKRDRRRISSTKSSCVVFELRFIAPIFRNNYELLNCGGLISLLASSSLVVEEPRPFA
jgi:hypothetical protein